MNQAKIVGGLKETSGQLEIEWQIADFMSLPSEFGTSYHSSIYFLLDSSWYLRIYPNGVKRTDESIEGDIEIFLMRGDSGSSKSVAYSVFLKKLNGRETLTYEAKKNFDRKNQGWGISNRISRCKLNEEKSEFLRSGVLTVICVLKCEGKRALDTKKMLEEVMKDSIDSTNVYTQTEANSGIEILLDDFKGLVVSGDHSDVTVRVQEEEFRLHSAILGARAPLFIAALKQELEKEKSGVIKLDDFETEAFRAFINYLYTGSADLLSPENALGLFNMADKYRVDHVKEICLGILKRMPISVDTFVDVVKFSLKHEVEELMEGATNFLSKNMAEVMVTEKWLNFLKNNLKQANELVVQAAIRKDESAEP